MNNWIIDKEPDKNGKYLITVDTEDNKCNYVKVLNYAKDLSLISPNFKKKSGWFDFDSARGYYEWNPLYNNKVAWIEAPEPYEY